MSKTRLDVLLFQRNLVESRERANAVIMSGGVYVEGSKALKPGIQVSPDAHIEIRESLKYVSRGGLKLEKALNFFEINPEGLVCVDCGASTGGFTDCLLQNGAKLVYAIDVGYGQLAWSIRSDSRVVTMERTNIRNVTAEMFEFKPQLAVVDVSFISLKLILPVLKEILSNDGQAVCLIKPQFEAGREKVGKNGVVRDVETKINVLNDFIQNAEKVGFRVKGLTYSPIKGPKGNIEFLCSLGYHGESAKINTRTVVMDGQEKLGD
jgi:23S rRNA (cytidine1920-2'-O)/16S rRNA (cytidine1409-2'-O)-methyltransferase